jgi:response regulator NasT
MLRLRSPAWSVSNAQKPAHREDQGRNGFMDTSLKILLVDESPVRAAIIEEGLRQGGLSHVVRLQTTDMLLSRIHEIDPDVVLIDLANPRRDELEQMFQVSRLVRRPITMFVDESDSEQTRAAIEAGVSAYIVNGLHGDRVKHIVDMCVTRFHAFARLQEELVEARSALVDRRVIDRAKALLMKSKGLDEEAAYNLMRRTAMNQNKRIADIARAIITASEVLG